MIPISKEKLDQHSKSHFLVSFLLAMMLGYMTGLWGMTIAFILGILWEIQDENYSLNKLNYPLWYRASPLCPNDSRGFSWLDIAMDFVGCALGYIILLLIT